MKIDARSLKLPAYVRDMEGGLYIIRQDSFQPLICYFSLVPTTVVIDEPHEFEK
jgi:hypothetical protein